MRNAKIILICFLCNLVWMSGCSPVLDISIGAHETAEESVVVMTDVGQYEITNIDQQTDAENFWKIDLNNFISDEESNCAWEGNSLVITAPGAYLLNGKLQGKNLVIRVHKDENVHLLLNNVEVHSQGEPAVYVEEAGKVVITAMEGTKNTFSDSPHQSDEGEACIFSNVDLTFNGSGSLVVYGYHRDAIRTKDCLKILNTNLYVKSKNDGLRGNDGVILYGSNVEVESENTGIKANSKKDLVVIEGSFCKIIAGENGISAKRYVSIQNSQTDLYAVLETISCDGIRNIEGEE